MLWRADMIIVDGYEYCKNDLIYFTSTEKVPCPKCGGKLHVRGTCERQLRRKEYGVKTYRLRVMECRECGRTHRELPKNIIPYKRMEASWISELAWVSHEQEIGGAESSVWRRVKEWVFLFLQYAQETLELLPRSHCYDSYEALKTALTSSVTTIANQGKWITASFGADSTAERMLYCGQSI